MVPRSTILSVCSAWYGFPFDMGLSSTGLSSFYDCPFYNFYITTLIVTPSHLYALTSLRSSHSHVSMFLNSCDVLQLYDSTT